MTDEIKPAGPNDITPGLDAVQDAVTSAGIENSTINQSLSDIQQQTTSIAAANAGNAVNGMLTGVATGITQISQGGTDNIIKGTLSLTTSVVSAASLAFGPAGAVVSGVFRGVATLVGSILGIFHRQQQSLASIIGDMINQAVAKLEKDGALNNIASANEKYSDAIIFITNSLNHDGDYSEDATEAIIDELNSMGIMEMYSGEIGSVGNYVNLNWSDSKQYENVAQVMFGYISMLSSKVNLLMQTATLYQRIGKDAQAEDYIEQARSESDKYAKYVEKYLPSPIYPALGVIAKMSERGYANFQNTVNMAANFSGVLPYQPQQNGWYNIGSLQLEKKGKQLDERGIMVNKKNKSVESDTKFTLEDEGWHLRMTSQWNSMQGPFNIVQVNLDDTPADSTQGYDKAVEIANGRATHAILFIEHKGFLIADDDGVAQTKTFSDHLWKRPQETLWIFI